MPALLKIKRTIENDIFKINFSLDVNTLPESDKELIRKFGEPQFNIGGIYLEDTDNEYTLPDKYIRIRSDLPFTQEFDAKSNLLGFSSSQAQALAFETEFINRYRDAFEEQLRAHPDTFSGERIENI
jgi:hypothetical protein